MQISPEGEVYMLLWKTQQSQICVPLFSYQDYLVKLRVQEIQVNLGRIQTVGPEIRVAVQLSLEHMGNRDANNPCS